MMIKKNVSEQGSALLMVTVILLVMVGISGAYLTLSWANKTRTSQDLAATQALFIAEAGAAKFVADLNANGTSPAALSKQYLAGGYYWVPTENLVDFGNTSVVGSTNLDANYFAFQVAGKYDGVTRRLNVVVNHQAGGVFWNAIFAGNKGADPSYTLSLRGTSGINDRVEGNIYVGKNFTATGGAQLTGVGGTGQSNVTFGTTGTNSSTVSANYTQGSQPDLSIPRDWPRPGGNMTEAQYKASLYNGNREPNSGTPVNTAWIDVGAQFAANGTANHNWSADGSFGTDITDINNPAHIFRKNPSVRNNSGVNRTGSYEHTVPTNQVGPTGNTRNDYYLEDPTNSNTTVASLTGVAVNNDTTASMLNIMPNGNNAVYYVPGNLRVSGENIKSYQLNPMTNTGDIKMTVFVQGNVSLTDNILYPNWQSQQDSLAIIALTDPAYPNSTPAMFTQAGTTVVTQPNGVTINQFITDYNSRAASARSGGLNMPDIDISTAAGQARASQEYNKIYGSGNVFYGDPGSGTVEHFEAYMYAENNFYATNLDTATANGGTSKVEIWGNMTAGNQVSIDRTSSQSSTNFIPLKVLFDPAIMFGNKPPGLPETPQTAGTAWSIQSWKQSAWTGEVGGDK